MDEIKIESSHEIEPGDKCLVNTIISSGFRVQTILIPLRIAPSFILTNKFIQDGSRFSMEVVNIGKKPEKFLCSLFDRQITIRELNAFNATYPAAPPEPKSGSEETSELENSFYTWMGFDSRYGRLLAGEEYSRQMSILNQEREFVSGKVMPASAMTITTRPQVIFKGERLCVSHTIAPSFLIHSLRIGTREAMTAGTQPIPADAFATKMESLAEIEAMLRQDMVVELSVGQKASDIGSPWTLPTAHVSMDVSLRIENIGDRPLRFVAGMLGRSPLLRHLP